MSAASTPFTSPAATSQIALTDARFIDLVTFRRTGEAISTPVLFVPDGDRLLVRTAADTGKLKRIRHTTRVQVAPSDQHGHRLGAKVEGTARILGPEAVGPTLARLHARYRIAGPLFTAFRRLRGQRDVIIEIGLSGGEMNTAAATDRRPGPALRVVASTTSRRAIAGVALTLLLAVALAACGSASVGSGQDTSSSDAASAVTAASATEPAPEGNTGGDGLGAMLCGIVTQADVERVLGAPIAAAVATDEGLVSGASCRYATADGKGRVAVWFRSQSTQADWMYRIGKVGMTDEEPLAGVGEVAFRTTGAAASRHVKVAAFGAGHDVWVDISGAPDAPTAATSAATFAEAILSGVR